MILQKVINCLSFSRLPWRALWITKTLTEGGLEERTSVPGPKTIFQRPQCPIEHLESPTKPFSSITRIVKNASADTNCASAMQTLTSLLPSLFPHFLAQKSFDYPSRSALSTALLLFRYKGSFQRLFGR